jgi:prepilin-type N-terminal cleavage/methylation domain-containing protein
MIKNQKGLALTEVLITIVILSVLAAVIVPSINKALQHKPEVATYIITDRITGQVYQVSHYSEYDGTISFIIDDKQIILSAGWILEKPIKQKDSK